MTCSRLNQICSSYFRRKHPANYVVISSSKGKVQLSPDQPYVYCFSEHFQSVIIYGADPSLFHFAATKFKEKPLKKVSFFAADNLTEDHAQIIDGIMQVAEVIEFIRCSTVGSLHNILKYCSNMKSLVLKSFNECKENGQKYQWLLQRYPRLEHLHWDLPLSIPPELNGFFQQNPTVTSIYGTEQLLPFIQQNSIKLNTLVLKLVQRVQISIFQQLRMMNDQESFQTVYLIGDLSHIEHTYPVLDNVEGISSDRTTTSSLISLFPRLKLLKTEIRSMKQAKDIAIQLIHLEEAYLNVNHIDYIVPLVRFATNLKKIFIDNTTAMKPGTKLSQLNLHKQRSKLAGAVYLKIYLKEEAYLKIKCMSICTQNCLVQFHPLEQHVAQNVFVKTILDK